jgi:hypothetical protein
MKYRIYIDEVGNNDTGSSTLIIAHNPPGKRAG